MAKISESRPPVLGQQHTYTITPGPDPGCRVTFLINGQPVNIRAEVGGLKVVGFSAGSMTVGVTGNFGGTTVEGRIDCPERPTIHAGPIVVGSGSYDNCDQEPCKSLRQKYINAAMLAVDQEKLIKPALQTLQVVSQTIAASARRFTSCDHPGPGVRSESCLSGAVRRA